LKEDSEMWVVLVVELILRHRSNNQLRKVQKGENKGRKKSKEPTKKKNKNERKRERKRRRVEGRETKRMRGE